MRRGATIEGPPGPIIVATRNDALDGIVDATPADRRKGARGREAVGLCFGAMGVVAHALSGRLDTCHPLAARRPDLVFIQNGMLQPWLDKRGLGDNTQARAAPPPPRACSLHCPQPGRAGAQHACPLARL